MLFLLMLLVLQPALALESDKPFRDFVIDRWDVKQGLPQITVSAITQDADGYLWFGTQAGLARFDGVRFQRFGQQDVQNLDSNIQALLADDGGRLWVGTAYGLLLLQDDRFQRVPLAEPSERDFQVHALARLGGKILVAGTDGVYTPQHSRLQRIYPLPGPALSLYVQGDTLWVGSNGCVYRIRQDKIDTLPLPETAQASPVVALAWHDGNLWAGGNRGLFRLQQQRWHAVTGIPARTVETMASDRDGTLWVATSQALLRLHQSHLVERLHDTPGSTAILSIFEDRDGDLWLGSQIEGVARLWNGYTRRLDTTNGLTSPLLWALSTDPDGRVWAGTADGLEVWQQGRFRRVLTGAQLPHPEVYSLLAETDQVWIGTRAGAARLQQGRLNTPPALAALGNTQINAILRDHRGALWFGTQNGLYLLESGHLQRFGTLEGLPDSRVRILYETRAGHLLIGTSSGLFEWRDGHILDVGRQTGMGEHTAVSAILELENGDWVLGSTSGDNLRVFDGKHWHAFDNQHGLPTNIPFHLATTDGNLWVAGMQGVYRLPLAQLEHALKTPQARLDPQLVINSGFNRSGGQQDKCCNGTGNGRGLLRNGQLWLPTREGILQVDTAAVTAALAPHPILIEGIHSQGRLLAVGPGLNRLPLDARELKFEFTVPAFQPINMPQLRYRLLGFEQQWHALDNPQLRSASYTNLPPGRYTFEVADFNRAKPLASAARLELDLPPHLYETLAFRVLLGLFAASLIWLGYLGLRYRYARQRGLLEQLVHERTRDLQAANDRLREISFTDALTGLHNRRYLTQQLPTDLAFYARDPAYANGSDAVIIALLDVDHFKAINDQWGHAAGDRVLEQLGRLLSELRRSGDYVARWGGEEFLLVLRPLPRGSLAQIGQRLCESVAAHTFDLGNGQAHRLTISVGLVECPLFPERPSLLDWDQLVTLADRAMYKVKTSGRNGWMACRPAVGAQLPQDAAYLEGNPRRLLDSGLLEMVGSAPST